MTSRVFTSLVMLDSLTNPIAPGVDETFLTICDSESTDWGGSASPESILFNQIDLIL